MAISPGWGRHFASGKPEIFRKRFSGATIELDWANLPNPEEYPKGLRSYYQEYANVIEGEGKPGLPPPGRLFANDKYQVTLARVTGRQRQDSGPTKTNGGSHKNSAGLPGATIGLFETGRFPAEVPSGAARGKAPGIYYPRILVERLKPSTTYVIPDQETGSLASLTSPGYPPGWTPQDGTGFFQIQSRAGLRFRTADVSAGGRCDRDAQCPAPAPGIARVSLARQQGAIPFGQRHRGRAEVTRPILGADSGTC